MQQPQNIEPQFQQLGEQFTNAYYQMFDSNRVNLQTLYTAGSLMTFEGEQFQGMQSIMTKLTNLQFKTVRHQLVKCDCQPAMDGQSGVLVFITGNLFVDDSPNPLKFAQTFYLRKEIQNDP